MPQYDNTNKGFLAKNRFKGSGAEDKDKPSYTGVLNISGVEYKLSAWLNDSDKLGKYLSIKVRGADSAPPAKKKDDDIPF